MTHKAISAFKIALYEPDIPQNTASIIRTCSCLGASLEIIEPCGFLLSDKRFKRVVLDYMNLDKLKFYESAEDFLQAKSKHSVISMTTKGKENYTDFKFKKNDTILFGKESAGVPKKIHKLVNHRLKIPMVDKKRSLNLSTSVSIVVAECLRQLN